MAAKKNLDKIILHKARKYLRLVEKEGIKVDRAYIYGSWAKHTQKEWSDIDIAIISRTFSGQKTRYWDILLPLVKEVDWRIEPMPFTPKRFIDENPLVWEIKKTGKRIKP